MKTFYYEYCLIYGESMEEYIFPVWIFKSAYMPSSRFPYEFFAAFPVAEDSGEFLSSSSNCFSLRVSSSGSISITLTSSSPALDALKVPDSLSTHPEYFARTEFREGF